MAAEPNAAVDTALPGAATCSQEPVENPALPAPGSLINPPERNDGPQFTVKPASRDHDSALVASSLARRALCPDCVQLGGCPLGILGLIPLPEKGEIEPITRKTRPYLEKLIKGTEQGLGVVAFRVRSRSGATRGETYLSGPSYCAAVRRGEIKPGEKR